MEGIPLGSDPSHCPHPLLKDLTFHSVPSLPFTFASYMFLPLHLPQCLLLYVLVLLLDCDVLEGKNLGHITEAQSLYIE